MSRPFKTLRLYGTLLVMLASQLVRLDFLSHLSFRTYHYKLIRSGRKVDKLKCVGHSVRVISWIGAGRGTRQSHAQVRVSSGRLSH
jgi:hypothetical protein